MKTARTGRRGVAARRPLLGGLLALLCLAGGAAAGGRAPLRLAYVDWSSSVASTYLICALVEAHLDRDCRTQEVNAEQMWARVADGRADAMLSAWLPDTHRHFQARYGDRVEDLGPSLEGTRTGLVVPEVRAGRQTGGRGERGRSYIPAQTIGDLAGLGKDLDGRIIGIDPEAGIMRSTRRAIEAYGLDGFRLVEGSEAAMTEALSEAIRRQQWIVVTGWRPHWMFGRWSLRFLDDPKGVYGGEGSIHTLARPGLDQDMPRVHRLLDRFHWRERDMEQLMVWIEQDGDHDPYAQAQRWMRTHPAQVQSWLE